MAPIQKKEHKEAEVWWSSEKNPRDRSWFYRSGSEAVGCMETKNKQISPCFRTVENSSYFAF